MLGAGNRGVEDQQMIAERIEPVRVAAVLRLEQVLPGAKLIIENPVAHFLRGGDLGLVAGKPHFEVADSAKRCASYDGIDLRPASKALLAFGRVSHSGITVCTSDSPSSHPSWHGDTV